MTVRFIKYIVKATSRRNSFYVTLGVSRLLHKYSTNETMDLFSLVVQDPERVRDDFYYRSRKKRLMEECLERFGNLLRVIRGYRGEQRFEEVKNPGSLIELVIACLKQFTPWNTRCVVQEPPDPYATTIPGLCFEGDDPDEEHVIEINRIHSIIHPDCFHRLTDSLSLGTPNESLSIPQFSFMSTPSDDDGCSSSVDRTKPPDLDTKDFQEVRSYLAERSTQRRQAQWGALAVKIDGRERARLDPALTGEVRLDAGNDTEMIEVYAENGVLLAAYLIQDPDPWDADGPQRSSIVLETGREIRFEIHRRKHSDDLEGTLEVVVGCRELNPLRAFALKGSRLKHHVFPNRGLGKGGSRAWFPLWVPVLVILIGAFLFFREMPPERAGSVVTETMPSPADGSAKEGSRLRGAHFLSTPLSLAEIENLYVDPMGDNDFALRLRRSLIERFASGDRFAIAADRERADAVFKKISEPETGPPREMLTISLVNADGATLWKATIDEEATQSLDPEAIAAEIVGGLLKEAGKDKR